MLEADLKVISYYRFNLDWSDGYNHDIKKTTT